MAPSAFVGWAGDLQGTNSPATLAMNADKTVRARFACTVPLPPGLLAFWRGEADASDLIGGHNGTFFAGTSVVPPSVTPSGKVSSRNLNQTWLMGLQNGFPQFLSHGATLLDSPLAIPLNQGTHLAISFDGATKWLYVNGGEASAFNKIRAFISRCAGPRPFRVSAASCSRSSPLNRTTYFFTIISFAAMIASVVRVTTKANHQIISNWLKRTTSIEAVNALTFEVDPSVEAGHSLVV